MSGRKNNLKSFKTIAAGDMSASSLTSAVTDIQHLDNVALQLNFSGSPVGTFAVQVSVDYDAATNTAGNWIPITLDPAPAATGSAGQIFIDLNQLSAPFVRVVYTKTSGTGSLDAFISGKMI